MHTTLNQYGHPPQTHICQQKDMLTQTEIISIQNVKPKKYNKDAPWYVNKKTIQTTIDQYICTLYFRK